MSRKHCKRQVVVAAPPPGLVPARKPPAEVLRAWSFAHNENLDQVDKGLAGVSLLWDMVENAANWLHTARELGVGEPEMLAQLELAEAILVRTQATGLASFLVGEYELAREGVLQMDHLATLTDERLAKRAARVSAAYAKRRRQELATVAGNLSKPLGQWSCPWCWMDYARPGYRLPNEGKTMNDDESTVVPIVESFGSQKPIGELRILTAALPPTPGFVFTLGFQALEMHATPGQVPMAPYVGAYKLCEVALQWDESYIAYLRQIGKL